MLKKVNILILCSLINIAFGGCNYDGARFAQFTINNNGTVTDNSVKLTWYRCVFPKKFNTAINKCDDNDGISIYPTTSIKPIYSWKVNTPWKNAFQAAVYANSQLYGGYSDWRLPNINELLYLASVNCLNPVIDSVLFPIIAADFVKEDGTTNNMPYIWSSTASTFAVSGTTTLTSYAMSLNNLLTINSARSGNLSSASDNYVMLVRDSN